MARAEEITAGGGGAWSRFARAFQSRRSSRWAWRALLLCVGLAVFAPLIANDRPYFARLRDAASFREATSLLMPITLSFVQQGKALATSQPGSQAEFDAEERALESRIAFLERASGSEHSRDPQNALFQLTTSEKALGAAARAHDAPRCGKLADELLSVASSTVSALAIDEAAETTLVAQTSWPLFRSLRALDIALMLSWLGLASFGVWRRCVPRGSIRTRVVALILVALVLGGLAQLVPHSNDDFDASLWKPRLAADAQSSCVFPPIAFGPSETHLDEAQHPPQIASRHWCGTDALGRDLFARLLYAGRTSFAVAALAALLIVSVGSALGLLAGALRGVVDTLVSRAIELLQSFPTLVLMLGLVALLPPAAANSRWTIPLVIAAIGWTHIARLARAEALRVNEMAFVRAATASGFSRARVLIHHVLPNSLGPVWVAASFVFSAGLVLESSAAFLGFGIQHPAPSWGGLLAEARGSAVWWLALFPGVWLFAAILSIHLVGEGVRDALDPRDEGGLR